MNIDEEARRFLRSTHHGILSTNSVKHAGYPFGSVTPFVLDHEGHPLILISTLAEHTKNIEADHRVSLLAFAGADQAESMDLQANARLTLLGEAEQADKNDTALRARYLRYFPAAEQYFAAHDFYFYRIYLRHARYIGGFGRIAWIEADSLKSAPSLLSGQEAAILDHMNRDHGDNLLAYCSHFHDVQANSAEMLGIDADGFDVRADGRMLRFEFESPVTDAPSARTALVAMAQACRA